VKLLFDESLSPKLVELLGDLFPASESALRNGLACIGDLRILEYGCAGGFVLAYRDFELLVAGLAAPKSSFCVRAIIQLESRPRYFGATRSGLPSCPVRKIV